jgi:Family of unknown function (DUF6510)
METLDGNAIGGLLHDVFGADMTTAATECAHCRASGILAECEVYLGGPGAVARCRTCRGLLLVVVEIRGVRCVDVRGLARLA